MFDVSSRSSPRQRDGSPRRRGPPRRGHVCLGEPDDKLMGPSGLLRRGCCLPGQRKAMPKRACYYLRYMFMACLRSILRPSL